ncbi:MAG: SusC/RagA family TonB-linked outer membrane protein [Niabella sp.]
MQRKRLLPAFITLFMLVCAFTTFAQTREVTGTVTDEKTILPVSGATVQIKGTSYATVTDSAGKYRILVPESAQLLEISSIGYATKEVPITGSLVDVQLTTTASSLENVVVIAYGTRKKSDLTGSVTAVTAKDFQKGNIGSSEQLLQGKVAGLEVTPGGGSAGGGSKIRIRGAASLNASNDPLIVIDGVPVESNGISGSANLLNTINPNDIESMSVLKDASAAALYGSRATNGVIIITTKKGASKKLQLNFNTRASLSQVANKVDVLSADQVRQIVNEKGTDEFKGFLGSANTDWQDAIYRKAFGIDNNLSAAGRADIGESFKLPYRISAGYYTQEGVLLTNKFDRYTAAINLSPKLLNDYLSFNINAKYARTNNRFADEGAIGSAVNFDPTQPVYRSDDKYGGYYEWEQSNGVLNALASRNPVAMLNLRDNTSAVNRFIGNVQADYKMHFFPDLHLLLNFGMDRSAGSGEDIYRPEMAASVLGYNSKGRRSLYEQTKTSKLADIQLFYQKDITQKTKIDVLLGHGYQDFYTDDVFFYSQFYDRSIDTVIAAKPNFFDDRNGFAIESYLGRVNFTLADKYLLTASLRRDASSKFSADNRVGYFPALAFAWKLKDELFPNAGNNINDLKLRIGWGVTGQQDGIAYYSYMPRYSYGSGTAQYQFGDQFVRFLRPSAYYPDVKWETTETTNIGLDYGFLQNRISGSIDIYSKKTKDLLSVVPVPPGSNFNVELLKNVGNLSNKGVEFLLNLVPVRTNKLTWDVSFNMAYNKTEVTKLIDFTDPNYKGISTSGVSGGTGNNIGKIAVGYTPYVYYPFKQVYDQSTGLPIEGLYEDINRDGQITDDDRYYYMKPAADFIYGLSTNVTVGKFSAGLAGHGMAGNYLYNNYLSNSATLRNILNPVKHLGNASVNYLETEFSNNMYLSDYYIENASFFRLDNINLGYNFGKILNNKASLRLSGSIQNVFVITKYRGADPENGGNTGVDNNIYPRPRIFSLGANIDF